MKFRKYGMTQVKKQAVNTLILLIPILLSGIVNKSYSQKNDLALINLLIENIAQEQVSTKGEFYTGAFPSYRKCSGVPHNFQPDNNIFYTGIIAFTLRNLLPYLPADSKIKAEQVIKNAQKAYPFYQNKQGDPFYNFWPTKTRILPHSYFVKYLNNLVGSGEDADDAVMILMASNSNDSICLALKKRLITVSNLGQRKISSTYKKYRTIPAYSTYLGLKMKPDFDFAVHCNILYFMFDRQLPLVKQDSATIQLLSQMIEQREYMKAPVYLSPYYVKTSILLYHIARLMGRFDIPELEKFKPQLITDIKKVLTGTNSVIEKIILCTSLLRLGADAPSLGIENIKLFEKSNQDGFVFFQARAAFSLSSPFKQILLHFPYLIYYFYCPAYNKVLWLEYLVARNMKN